MYDQYRKLDSRFEKPSKDEFERLAQAVQDADPLGFDDSIGTMVAYNDLRDVVGIENLLHEATAGVSKLLSNINPVDAIA